MADMRILVVEDSHKIAGSIKKGLEQEGYTVDLAYDGQDGYDLAIKETYALIILDLMLPSMDGIEFCRRLREQKNYVPILILTAKGLTTDKVVGLDSGADDYLTKPFDFEELLARVRAMQRRPKESTDTILKTGNLSLNTITHLVKRDDQPIQLSAKEYALLEYLLRHPNQPHSKEQIISHVWDYDADVLPNTVEVYIGYLRNKIDKPFPHQPSLIQTIRGFGYKVGVME